MSERPRNRLRLLPPITRLLLVLFTIWMLAGFFLPAPTNLDHAAWLSAPPWEVRLARNEPTPNLFASPTETPSAHEAQSRHAASSGAGLSKTSLFSMPIYQTFDFTRDYLTVQTYPILLDAKPWDNSSTNFHEYQQPFGGTSYWDYWPDGEPWDSPNHQWRDEEGQWHSFATELITGATGTEAVAYVLVDRRGPGVMDKLWFTHDAVHAVFFLNAFDPPELADWGNLSRLGNLRIEVDDRIVFDGPIQTWFSGEAQRLTPGLRSAFVWHYRQFGSTGNIIPIPYQTHLKVSVYGGSYKPKWFMATGLCFPAGTQLQSYSTDGLPLSQMDALAKNVLQPETYIDSLALRQSVEDVIQPGEPVIQTFTGSGTLQAVQLRIAKQYDLKDVRMQVKYGDAVGLDLPLLAFFGEPGRVALHHSTPIGIIEVEQDDLFYSNLPMPYQAGMTLRFSTDGDTPIPVRLQVATSDHTFNTQLRATFEPGERLQVFGPDYRIHLDGSGKLVGLVLSTFDQDLSRVPRMRSNGQDEDPDKRVWPMGYLEGNLTLTDGAGNARYYSGQEDWAEGGFYFNLGYSTVSGGGNRPFAGILRYKQAEDGYATLFRYFTDLSALPFQDGLDLSFGHGTWNNNFAVTYAATVLYYARVGNDPSVALPASNYLVIRPPGAGLAEP